MMSWDFREGWKWIRISALKKKMAVILKWVKRAETQVQVLILVPWRVCGGAQFAPALPKKNGTKLKPNDTVFVMHDN